MPVEETQDEISEFDSALEEALEAKSGKQGEEEEADEVDEKLAEDEEEESEDEGEDGEEEEAPPANPDPRLQEENDRKSILGRIEANRRGADKLIDAYKKRWPGQALPFEKTKEQLAAEAKSKESYDTVEKETPEILEAARLIAQQEVDKINKRMSETEDMYERRLEMVRHEATIRALHPDYDTYRDSKSEERQALEEWVDSLPTKIGLQVRTIISSGTAPQVSEVLSAFKEFIDEAAEEQNDNSQMEQEDEEVNALAASVVRGDDTRVLTNKREVDKDNFDDALEEALALKRRKG
jgi:hypothetical protein